jgi:hypothetical protein
LAGVFGGRWRIAGGVALAALAALPAAASGATTIGQTSGTGSNCSGSGFTFLQDTVAGPPSYEAPTGGVITSWSHDALAGTASLRLKVYRRTSNPDQYSTVGESAPELPPPGLNTFATRIAVEAGDILGLSLVSGAGPSRCLITTTAMTDRARQASGDPAIGALLAGPYNGASMRRINVSAQLEPDADGDGFGDESQDGCPTDASAQGACPDTDPPETTFTKDAPKTLDRSKFKFKFRADEPGSTFACRVDKKRFRPCTSPRVVKRLDEGKHKFLVVATDAAGNADATPAKDKFKVIE